MEKRKFDIEYYLLHQHFLKWVVEPTPELNAYWDEWMKEHPSEKANIVEAQRLIASLQFEKDILDPDKRMGLFHNIEKKTTGKELNVVYENIKHYVKGASGEFKEDSKEVYLKADRQLTRFRWANTLKIAASLLVIITTLIVVNHFIGNSETGEPQFIAKQDIVKKSIKGQKLTTYLPDGTKVIINSNSELKYGADYGSLDRKVTLKGEAFFEVVKDTLNAFIVSSNKVKTVALGTSFNVRTRDNGNVEVALVTGKVKVETETKSSVMLLPGDKANVDEKLDISISNFDYIPVVGWKDGLLVFKDNSLPEIIEKLESWYGVAVISERQDDPHFNYSGINKNETLDEVLHGISFVHHFNYEITGDTVRIY